MVKLERYLEGRKEGYIFSQTMKFHKPITHASVETFYRNAWAKLQLPKPKCLTHCGITKLFKMGVDISQIQTLEETPEPDLNSKIEPPVMNI
jgi:hypothetical protein